MIKLLFDTDIGSDVDDAVCLAYLLSHPECDLLGITTVTGEADRRAALASALCRAAGKAVPIYPGAEQPLAGAQMQPVASQARALSRWLHDTAFPTGQAVDFLHHAISENPGEVVLLTTGPLTNAAILFSLYPGAAAQLKALVLMGGLFLPESPGRRDDDWNIALDLQAAAIVYQAPAPVHRSVGLDVTRRLELPAEEVRRRFTAPFLQPVLDFAGIYFGEGNASIVFHDPLAAAVIFDETLVEFARGRVEIDPAGERYTAWRPGGPDAPHEVAVRVDRERYFEHFFSVVNG